MRIIARLALVAVLVALGFWLYTVLFPSPEKVIRKRLAEVAQLASIRRGQGLLSLATSIQELANCFDSQVEITLNWRGRSDHSLAGRDEIIEAAKLAHGQFKTLEIEFLDMNVMLAPDKQSATVNLTAKVTTSEDRDFQVQEFIVTLKKVNGEWLIFKIETVRTLSQLQTNETMVVARA